MRVEQLKTAVIARFGSKEQPDPVPRQSSLC
jgi:hypothetical protein